MDNLKIKMRARGWKFMVLDQWGTIYGGSKTREEAEEIKRKGEENAKENGWDKVLHIKEDEGEDIRSIVYNALAEIAHKTGADGPDMYDAVEWFFVHFYEGPDEEEE